MAAIEDVAPPAVVEVAEEIIEVDESTLEAIDNTTMKKEVAKSQWNAKNPYSSKLTQNFILNGKGSGKETRHIVFDLGDSGLEYKAGDALGVIPICPPEVVADLLSLGGFTGEEEVETNLGICSLYEALSTRYEVHRVSKKWIEGLGS